MTKLNINGRSFDIDLIVFDKDGTLIELDFLWSQQIEKWGRMLQAELQLETMILHTLYEQVGYDFENGRLIPDAPAAVATVEQFVTIASFLLYQKGIAWTAAEEAVQATAKQSIAAPPERSMLRLIGDVESMFKKLHENKIRIAILTSDDRHPTEKTMEMLGLTPYISAIVCANDPLPCKPAPDGLFHISKETGVPTKKMLMVGDSTGDMRCGWSAGVAGCIGVGAIEADVNIRSIEEINLER